MSDTQTQMNFPTIEKDEIAKSLLDKMLFAVKDDDDEVAHGKEDDLRHRVLELISNGHPDSILLAREVLQTSQLAFSRWCA